MAKPTLSPMIAAAEATTISVTMSMSPWWASSAAAISAVSPGTGMPIVSIAISAKTAAYPTFAGMWISAASTLRL